MTPYIQCSQTREAGQHRIAGIHDKPRSKRLADGLAATIPRWHLVMWIRAAVQACRYQIYARFDHTNELDPERVLDSPSIYETFGIHDRRYLLVRWQ